MCPCPICATLAIILAPFLGYKWAKKKIQQHHCHCNTCQDSEKKRKKQRKKKITLRYKSLFFKKIYNKDNYCQ